MKTSKITHIKTAVPPTWANPNDGSVFNRYDVTFANGELYTFLARGEFKRQVGEDANYEIKSLQHKTAKLIQDPKPQFVPTQTFNKHNVKDEYTQTRIIRQSSASTAANFYSKKNVESEEIINLARQIEQYVNNG